MPEDRGLDVVMSNSVIGGFGPFENASGAFTQNPWQRGSGGGWPGWWGSMPNWGQMWGQGGMGAMSQTGQPWDDHSLLSRSGMSAGQPGSEPYSGATEYSRAHPWNQMVPEKVPTATSAPGWRRPTNWFQGDFPGSAPQAPAGKLGYDDWYDQIGKNYAYSISFGSPAATYLEYIGYTGGGSSGQSGPTGDGVQIGTDPTTGIWPTRGGRAYDPARTGRPQPPDGNQYTPPLTTAPTSPANQPQPQGPFSSYMINTPNYYQISSEAATPQAAGTYNYGGYNPQAGGSNMSWRGMIDPKLLNILS